MWRLSEIHGDNQPAGGCPLARAMRSRARCARGREDLCLRVSHALEAAGVVRAPVAAL